MNVNTILNPDMNNMHVGAEITIFGMVGTISVVEPESDWFWSVEVEIRTTGGTLETMTMTVPTDFRTTDGYPASPEARAAIKVWEKEAEDAADDRLHHIESMACDR